MATVVHITLAKSSKITLKPEMTPIHPIGEKWAFLIIGANHYLVIMWGKTKPFCVNMPRCWEMQVLTLYALTLLISSRIQNLINLSSKYFQKCKKREIRFPRSLSCVLFGLRIKLSDNYGERCILATTTPTYGFIGTENR